MVIDCSCPSNPCFPIFRPLQSDSKVLEGSNGEKSVLVTVFDATSQQQGRSSRKSRKGPRVFQIDFPKQISDQILQIVLLGADFRSDL
jgi:hypothetical protein